MKEYTNKEIKQKPGGRLPKEQPSRIMPKTMARQTWLKRKERVLSATKTNPEGSYASAQELEEQGVRLIAPVFAGTTLDTPTLPPELYSIFEPQAGQVFIDAGGDDAGVTALGGLHSQLEETGYQMLYVINRYRVLSQTPEEAAALLQEIETASRLKATALVNNSHLGAETRLDTLLGGLDFARKTAQLTGLPLLYSTAPDFALRDGETLPEGFKRIQRHVKFMWE